jgi:signal transduction histidine kinase
MAIEEVVDSFHFWIEVITTILFLKNLDSHKIWTQSIRTTTLLASAFLFYYVGFIQRILDSDGPALPTLRSALFFASFAVGVFSFIQWLRRLAVHLRQSNLHLRLSSLSFNDYYIVVIITNWIIFLLSMTIIKTIYDSSSVEYRVIVTVFRTIYTFVIAFVPGRMIRHESLQYYLSSETEHLDRENKRLEDMLNMKRTFVRHVSHEVR